VFDVCNAKALLLVMGRIATKFRRNVREFKSTYRESGHPEKKSRHVCMYVQLYAIISSIHCTSRLALLLVSGNEMLSTGSVLSSHADNLN